jgi:aspartokinase-like uncharacterized kinase
MKRASVRIVKVGGSLFDLPDLRERLEAWRRRQPPATNVFLAGGGNLAEAIRQLDQLHHLTERDVHWLSIEAMSVTAKFLRALLHVGLLRTCDEIEDALADARAADWVLDPLVFYDEEEPCSPGTKLPTSASVTSDSIAARLAEVLHADELVLLKSRLPDSISVSTEATSGYVDEFFPSIAGKLQRVRCVNMRSANFEELAIHAGEAVAQ